MNASEIKIRASRTLFGLLTMIGAFSGCDMSSKVHIKPVSKQDNPTELKTLSALALSFKVVEDIELALVSSGMSTEQAKVIGSGALAGISGATGSGGAGLMLAEGEPTLATYLPEIISGAMKATSDQGSGLGSADQKISAIGVITSGMFNSLNGKMDGLSPEVRNALPGSVTKAAVSSLGKAGLSGSDMSKGLGKIMSEGVGNLKQAGFSSDDIKSVVRDMTKSSVAGMKSNALDGKDVAMAMKQLMSSTVGALGATGVKEDSIGGFVGPIMTEAVGGLATLGISDATQMQTMVSDMMGSSVKALTVAGVTKTENIGPILNSFVSGAMAGISQVGVEKNKMGSFVGDMMKEAVGSLDAIGVRNANDIKNLAATVSAGAIATFKDIGITDASTLKSASQAVASGTMKALGGLNDRGILDKSAVQESSKLVSEKSVSVMFQSARDGGFANSIGDLASGFAMGMVSGLASAGWAAGDISTVSSSITSGFSAALQGESSIDSGTLVAMTTTVTNSTNSWVNTIAMGSPADGPSPEQMDQCISSGRIIKFDTSGHWYCASTTETTGYLPPPPTTGGAGAAVIAVIKPNGPDFWDVPTGQTSYLDFILKNQGGSPATAVNFGGFYGPFSVDNTGTSCGATINPGQECYLRLAFQSASPTTMLLNLGINFYNGNGPVTINEWISGTALAAGALTLSPSTFTPFVLGTSPSQAIFTLTNSGGSPATGIAISGINSPFTLTGASTCGTTLASGTSCYLYVEFSQASVGHMGGTLVIDFTTNDGPDSVQTGLWAIAINPVNQPSQPTVQPLYSVAPNWLDYVYLSSFPTDIYNLSSPIACTGSESYSNYRCIHGGELRKVALPNWTSCYPELSAVDSLDAFNWRCQMIGGFPYMVSYGLKENRRLADLVNLTSWKNNNVMVAYQSQTIFNTAATVWYGNPVNELADNSSGPATTISTSGIYTLGASRTSHGYNLNADKIAVTTLNNAELSLNPSTADNCTFDGDMDVTPATGNKCLVSASNNNFIWIEGSYNGSSLSSVQTKTITLRYVGVGRIRYAGTRNSGLNGTGLNIRFSNNARVDHYRTFNDYYGLNISISNNVVASNIIGTNAYLYPVSVDQSSDVIVTRVTAFHNGNSNTYGAGIYTYSGFRNKFAFLTLVGNSAYGFQNYRDDYDTISSALFVNNGASGLRAEGNVAKTRSMTAGYFASTDNANYGIDISGLEKFSMFTGPLVLGNNPSGCLGGTDYGITNACAPEGISNFALISNAASLNGTFYGNVTSNDVVNGSNTSGTTSFSGINDWFAFENEFRAWGKDNASFLAATNRGYMSSGTARIGDMSVTLGDAVIRNKSGDGAYTNDPFSFGAPCPSEVDGNMVFHDSYTIAPDYLVNAFEIIGDFEGNDNGLCESNEACVYAPNWGAYQGHGAYTSNGTCQFQDGAITNVKLYAYPTNGR